jgi:hypothetical protein
MEYVRGTRHTRTLALASVLLVLLAAPIAPAARTRQFPLTVAITGKGTVRLSGGRQIACAASCKRTVLVRAGSKVALTVQPGTGWKFSTWAGACRGTASTCRLRMNRAARVGVTLVPPGAKTNPIPLSHSAGLDGGWMFTVISAKPDATQQIAAIPGNNPPPSGAQYAMRHEVVVRVVRADRAELGRKRTQAAQHRRPCRSLRR